jgi:hypothetical protein
MAIRDIAREWLGRPMIILICGRGEYAQRLDDDYVSVAYAQSRAQLEARFSEHPLIDVAIIEDTPWPGEDASNVCRTVRARGIGTVFAARTTEAATRLLRDRVTLDLSAADLAKHVDTAVWVACVETEIMRRDTPDVWKKISSGAPPFLRYIEEQGQLAPSKSTMAYIFDDAPRASVAEGTAPLVAPAVPGPVVNTDENRSTALLQPSASFLQSLRQMRRQRPSRRFWTWAAISAGAVLLLLALGLLLMFVPELATP